MLADIHERLTGVTIEQLGYADFIRRYDRPGMLFYLDPPYWGCEGDYGPGVFSAGDFTALAELLAGISGQFIMSINDTQAIRETFAPFKQHAVETTYTLSRGDTKRAGELIISNFTLPV